MTATPDTPGDVRTPPRVKIFDTTLRDPVATLADGVKVKEPGTLTRALLRELLDDVVIVREAELRETLVRLALEEHVIAEGAGALALAAGRRVAGKRKCAVVSGGNVDAGVLAQLLCDVRPRPPRKPRRRAQDARMQARLTQPAATRPATPAAGHINTPPRRAISGTAPTRSTAASLRRTEHEIAEELPA